MSTDPTPQDAGGRCAEFMPCVSCRLPLPILICPDEPEAVSLECVFCGGRYRGVICEDAERELMRNVRVVE